MLFLCAMVVICCTEPDPKVKKTDTANGNYLQNRYPLKPTPYLKLPLGIYSARGMAKRTA